MEAKKYRLDHPPFKKASTQPEITAAFSKNAVTRLSTLTHSNSFSLLDKNAEWAAVVCALEKLPSQRSGEEIEGIARMLKQENLFPELKNSLTIMRVLARQIKVKPMSPQLPQPLSYSNDTLLYKLCKGEGAKKKARDTLATIKTRGELVKNYQQCKQATDIQITCKEESKLLVLSQQDYAKALNIDRQNKATIQLLAKTSIFSKLKKKELFHLVQNCSELALSGKELLFDEADPDNGFFYFLVQGELTLLRNNAHKKQVLCYLTSGSLLGQEILFQQGQPRSYAVAVQSSVVKVLPISRSTFYQTIKRFELDSAVILTQQYREFLQLRKQHHASQLGENCEIKQTFQPTRYANKMSPIKRQRMSNLLKDIENFTLQLNQKERILEKRYQLNKDYKDCELFSIDRPLFGSQDFPGLKQLIKRYGVNESKAKENCRLPQL